MRSFGIPEFLYVLEALKWTFALSLIGFIGGAVLGVILAVARCNDKWFIRNIAIVYTQFFQGIPLLLLMLLCYYGISLIGIQLSPLMAATVALTLNGGAFLGAIWESALRAIPKAQWESGESLALRPYQTLRYIIAPQAIRIALPATVGFVVQLVKESSLASVIGFVEITRAGQLVTNITFTPLQVFGLVAFLYFIICCLISWLSRKMEYKFNKAY